ncbi:peptidase S66 [Fervidicella metallireducens AeB]|uniref:Peptidase S66 n=1 Tax=Fervidicella metallireducens AeB TaxID=1403537 RepID=A0A017RSW2_9CLOT|nr:LD-carboxypeptidase [Fervidicella metallireducens]EYE87747.1 peptidase S66 [Fervidicella metallireducens AeB]
MIKPYALKKGDTIGVVAPASPTKNILDVVEKAKTILEKQGFKVIIGESCYKQEGYLAGTDEIRAKDINQMFSDKNIRGIFCLRGGYGSPRILDRLDYDLIRKNPKVFLGYSDITAIHIALYRKCKLITFHGPMVASDMIDEFDEFSMKSYSKAVTVAEPIGIVKNPENIKIMSLVSGKAKGRIVGGNLSLIAATIGTPYEIDTNNKILFLEEIDEFTYSIDRMLTQLRLSGKLKDCLGIVIGDFKNCFPQYEGYDCTLMEVFKDIIAKEKKPTIYNLMAGHCKPKITIPLGAEAVIDADNCTLEIIEAAVK